MGKNPRVIDREEVVNTSQRRRIKINFVKYSYSILIAEFAVFLGHIAQFQLDRTRTKVLI